MTERARLFLDICTGLFARFAPSLLSLFCVPIYLHLLGASAYAAVGLAIALQMIVGLLDFGFSATITREAARISGTDKASPALGTLLRTFELLFWAAAILIIGIGFIFGYKILALVYGDNIGVIGLTPLDAWLLFASLALRFPYSCYSAYLVGLTQVSKANTALATNDILRALVAVALLSQWEASLTVFFAWQAISSLLTSVTGWWLAHRAVHELRPSKLISLGIIRKTGGLTAGAGALSILFVFVASIDKLVLPQFISAIEFGQYVALTQLATGAFTVVHAVWAAFNPRLQTALAMNDDLKGRSIYEISIVLMAAFSCGAVMIAGTAGGVLAYHWSGIDRVTGRIIFVALVIGFVSGSMAHLAMSIQHAVGTLKPLLPAFAATVIVLPISYLFIFDAVNLTTSAVGWGGLYVFFFLACGSATHFTHARKFFGVWVLFGILPFLTTCLVSIFVGTFLMGQQDIVVLFVGGVLALIAALTIMLLSARVRGELFILARSLNYKMRL